MTTPNPIPDAEELRRQLHLLSESGFTCPVQRNGLTEHIALAPLCVALLAKLDAKPVDVLAICTAYESGYGHGQNEDGLESPYKAGSQEDEAYRLGYDEGYNIAKLPRSATPAAVAVPEGYKSVRLMISGDMPEKSAAFKAWYETVKHELPHNSDGTHSGAYWVALMNAINAYIAAAPTPEGTK